MPDRIEDLVTFVEQPGAAMKPVPLGAPPFRGGPWEDVRADIASILQLRDLIQAYAALPSEAFTIVAPPGWAGGAVQVYGIPVASSADVNRPGLTIDPRS